MNLRINPNRPSILAAIGNTPMVKLPWNAPLSLFAKLEYLNPGGSIKDRSALYMIERAEQEGLLKPGYTLIEGSSGNQGIAVAMIGAIKGYKVIITVPARTSKEKVATLKAYGAEVMVCQEHGADHGYTEIAQSLHKNNPKSFMPNQYYNAWNSEAHYLSTGPEIWQQTEGKVTHVVLAMGSCGTVMGVGRYLKQQNPTVQIIGVDAATSALSSKTPAPYTVEGIGVDVLDGLYNGQYVDRIIPVEDEDAFAMTKFLPKLSGLLVGLSSGAVMHAVYSILPTLSDSACVVVILADSGRAYLSKVFIDEAH